MSIACPTQNTSGLDPNKTTNNVTEFRLSEDFRQLFKNGEFTDVVLSVNGKKYKAHKIILIARSPVFANMFKHENMRENQQNEVVITDFDEQVVEEMLNYIYTGTSDKLEKWADELLIAAEKYALDGLKNKIENILSEKLSVENAIETLIFADLQRAHELKSETINFIVKKSAEVMKTTAWKNIVQTPSSCPHLLVEMCEAFSRQLNEPKPMIGTQSPSTLVLPTPPFRLSQDQIRRQFEAQLRRHLQSRVVAQRNIPN